MPVAFPAGPPAEPRFCDIAVRAPRLSESGLCRGCTRSHRRKAPQIAGDFESRALRRKLVRNQILTWRRERDSNPRYGFPYTRSPGVRLQPLGHPSVRLPRRRRTLANRLALRNAMPLARVGGAKAAPWHAAERYAMLPSRHSFV